MLMIKPLHSYHIKFLNIASRRNLMSPSSKELHLAVKDVVVGGRR